MPRGDERELVVDRDRVYDLDAEDSRTLAAVGAFRIVERHTVPGVAEEGYSVEFFDMTGNTVGVATLPATALRMPTPADRPAARALSA